MRKLCILGMTAVLVLLIVAPALAQQTYPPTRGCTAQDRARFHRHQHAETLAFNAQQRQARQIFHSTGPHSLAEKRAFARAQQQERLAFQRQHASERRQFQANCRAGVPPQFRAEVRPQALTDPAPTRPVLRVWQLAAALGLAVSVLLLRRRIRGSYRSR